MYRIIPAIFFILFLLSCGGGKKKLFMPDSSRWTDQDVPLNELDTGNVNADSINISEQMKKLFPPADSLIEGRPVSYYLNRGDISTVAKKFYLQMFIPSDDNITESLCDSLLTKNDTTRPFYYFLYIRLHQIADGALAEMLPDYALAYSTQFTDEFYKKLRMPQYRSSYEMWVNNVSYMVWNLLDKNDARADSSGVRQYIVTSQMQNVKHLNRSLRNDIEKFATDVAANPNN